MIYSARVTKTVFAAAASGFGLCITSAHAWQSDNGDGTFTNPALYADYPAPDIIRGGLNYSITGLPYWTTDTGGFFHPRNQYTSPDYNELLTRWFQWSTFCPILRIHGFGTATEIWNWLPATQTNLTAFDELRYRMLPTIIPSLGKSRANVTHRCAR
jgi:hypothetical protein